MKLWFSLIVGLGMTCSGFVSAQGDPAAGQQKSAACVACHGTDGNSVNPVWPKIAGQSAQYVRKQLLLFKNGHRVNPLMNPQSAALSEQDIDDLAAHFNAQKTSPGSADPALFERGQAIYRGGIPKAAVPACISCHGPAGSGNPAAGFPKMSFQHAAYTAARLRSYRSQPEHPDNPGGVIMNGVAENMKDDDIEAVSAYIQGLH